MDKICAIVVTYHPHLELLRQNLVACRAQVDRLIIVDNGSSLAALEYINTLTRDIDCIIIQLGKNLGVAAAQNHGINRARADGCSFVLLLDQDSNPAPNMVEALYQATSELTAHGLPFAAVGPRLIDRRTGVSTPFVHFNMFGTTRMTCTKDSKKLILTDFIVSSGMLIPLSVLQKVGLPEEGLFIDNVDLEWCFRARSMGLEIYGVCNAAMTHSVGDKLKKFGRYVIYQHSPLRQYYIMRNRIALYQRDYSPYTWIIQDFARMLFKLLAFSLFFYPRIQNFRMMIKGIKDGLTGKNGEFR